MQKLVAISLLFSINFLMAKISLSNCFSDNMVIQRDSEIPIWGFAKPNEKVTISFKDQIKSTIADESGHWKVILNKENFGGPFEMKIAGENEIILKNILIGDVWLCSGQSNMEWVLQNSDGYESELQQDVFPLIRQIKIEKSINTIPQNDVLKTSWKVANSNTIGDFSGVAYFFAKKIFNENKIPIGIINASWGGTNIESWISRDAFENSEDFKQMISKMPKIAMDSLPNYITAAKISNIEKLQKVKIQNFKPKIFLKTDFDDENLAEIEQPKIWEEQQYIGLDGIAWLRKTIDLDPEETKKNAKIFLSKIDDEDETYFNGKLIGSNKIYDTERVYEIPKKYLKKEKNVITIRVVDSGGGGGIWGNPENLKLVTSQKTISLAGNWKFYVEKIDKKINENEFPSLVYNAMIAPLTPLKIKGILWYQGESNADRAVEYKKSFPLLINSWREKFGENIPFYFVQLASFTTPGNNSNEGSSWAELREAQTSALKLENTGMVVTTDIGNPKDIHPTNKKSVGERLANLELKNGKISPILRDFTISRNEVSVGFTPNSVLKTTDTMGNLKGFEIAGSDKIFYPAEAKLKNNRVVVSNENVKIPVAVRFGWKGDSSENNLFTIDDLPVSPFRTDNFPLTTENAQYKIELK